MPLFYPEKLKIGNTDRLGIVDEKEVSGTRSVKTLEKLYEISDPILSPSNDGEGSLGQEWYVEDEAKWYRLVSWDNRDTVDGWKQCDPIDLVSYISVDKNAEIEYNVNCPVGDRAQDFNSHSLIYGFMTRPYEFVEYEETPPSLSITSITLKSPPSSIRQTALTDIEKTAFRPHFWVKDNETTGTWIPIGYAVDAKGFTALDETLTWDNIVVLENISSNSALFVSFCANASGGTPTEYLSDTVPIALQVRPPNMMNSGGSQNAAEYMVNSADGNRIVSDWVPECDINFNYSISKVSVELSKAAQAENANSLQSRSQIDKLIDDKLETIESELETKQDIITVDYGLRKTGNNISFFHTTNFSGFEAGDDGAIHINLANFDSAKLSEDTVTKVVYDTSGQLAVPHAETMSSDTGVVNPKLITNTYPYLNELNVENLGYSGDETPVTFANYASVGDFGNWNNFGGFTFNLDDLIPEVSRHPSTSFKLNGIILHTTTNTNQKQGLGTPFYLNVFKKPKDSDDSNYTWVGAASESCMFTATNQLLTVNFNDGIIIDPKTDIVLITFASTNTQLESYTENIIWPTDEDGTSRPGLSMHTRPKLGNYSWPLRNTDGGSNWQFLSSEAYSLVADIIYSLPDNNILVSDLPIAINSEAKADNEVPNLGQTKNEILNTLNGCKLWTGTQADYDALDTKDDKTIYFIVEG